MLPFPNFLIPVLLQTLPYMSKDRSSPQFAAQTVGVVSESKDSWCGYTAEIHLVDGSFLACYQEATPGKAFCARESNYAGPLLCVVHLKP